MEQNFNDSYISLEIAAEYLDIKPVTLRKWINQKRFASSSDWQTMAIKKSELDAWFHSVKSAVQR